MLFQNGGVQVAVIKPAVYDWAQAMRIGLELSIHCIL